jgi:hypothetical protein
MLFQINTIYSKMKKVILILVAFIALNLNLSAQSDVSPARWKSKEIVIDGNYNEWTKPLNFYDDKSGLVFAICNDTQNLYLCFTTKDEMKMRKMMNAGWKVDFNSKEKKKKFKAEIEFPAVNMTGVGMGMGMRKGDNGNDNRSPISSPIEVYRLNLNTLAISGFKSDKTEMKLNDKSGINIAVGADSLKHIVYEFAIPFRELYGDQPLTMGEEITMNVTVNGMERPNSPSGSYNSGSAMSGRGGGMGGGRGGMGGGRGGMGGGRQGGGMSRGGGNGGGGFADKSGIYDRATFKQKFTLVSKQ